MRFLFSIISFFSIVTLIGCENNEVESLFNAPVYFEIDVRSGRADYKLAVPNQYIIFDKTRLAKDRGVGLGGLLVVSSGEPLIGTSFYHLFAYDLACPHERDPKVKIVPNSKGKAKCPKCGSIYDIFNGGFVQSGISKNNLERYYAYPSNQTSGVFTISQ